MIAILSTCISAGIAFGFFRLVIWWCRIYTSDLKAASELLDQAYAASQQLIRDERTPESVLTFIAFFSSRIGTPHLARSFAWRLFTGALTNGSMSPVAKHFHDDLSRLDARQKSLFAKLISAGMVSSAASDPIFARLYMASANVFLSNSGREDDAPSEERVKTVAADFAARAPGLCVA